MQKADYQKLKDLIQNLREIRVRLIEIRDKRELVRLDKALGEVKNGRA